MPILPLPQFEADMAEQDAATYERLKPPSSIVARFGIMGLIGEFPFGLDAKPGCGTKFVLRTQRGTELGEMLTSTCPNSGCGKSISRKEMLEYIDRSGGKDYPFFSMTGKVLRIATVEDLNAQMAIDEKRPHMTRQARAISQRMNLPMKVVDAEPILGGEKITFYFTSEDRVDFREMVTELAAVHQTRIEMRQVGGRDEARLTADYEKCGQHCCCKQFLKVLKPVSMKNAKIQKATLDPLKISGRCGRLMCCLRYEEQSYDDLRARLPKKRTRVQCEHGTGFVLDTQILTQLVLVQLDDKDERVAVALEELTILGPGVPPQQQKKVNAEEAEEAEGAEMEVGGEGGGPGGASPPRADAPPRPDNRPREGDRPRDQRPPQQSQQQRPGGPGGPGGPPQGQRSGGRPQWPTAGGGGGGGGQRPQHSGAPRSDGPRPGGPQDRSPQDRPFPERPQQDRPQPDGRQQDRSQPDRPQSDRPPQDRAPQPRPPQQRDNRPPQSRPPERAPQGPIDSDHDEIDDLLSDIETDMGDGPNRGPGASPGSGGQGSQGGQGGGGRKRRRKRRRGGGGGPGGPPGGGGGGGGGGPPPV